MIIHSRQKRWTPRHWCVVGAAAALALSVTWWFSDAGPPARRGAPRAASLPSSAEGARRDAPVSALAAPAAAPPVENPSQVAAPSGAALSVTVAPGVHITPMSVPPGTLPKPAGPTPNDSEPEN